MSFVVNLLGPRTALDGGLFLPEHKSFSARRPIEKLHLDGPLHVPLTAHRDLQTLPIVAAGDRVLMGQRLSRSIGYESVPVHAPVSGTIVDLSRVWSPFDGFLPCAVLEPDGQEASVSQRQGWEDESLIVQLAEKGVFCCQPREPLHVLIQRAVAAGVTELIVNAMETEPYLTADLRTLLEQPGRIIDVTCELADALGVSHARVVMPFRHRRMVKRLMAEAVGRHIEISPLADPYPQCHPIALVKALLGREVPPGDSVLDEGVVVLPLSAVRSAAVALLDDRPITEALMTVAGDAVERVGTYRVAIGTPLRRVAEHVGLVAPVAKAICGGPLTGLPVGHADAVVTSDMNALLLFRTEEHPDPVPCIRCGWCIEDCPVGIDPPSLMRLESNTDCHDSEWVQLKSCLDCGLCSYVCPSHLPLSESILRIRSSFERARDETEAARA